MTTSPSSSTLVGIYRRMVLIKRNDERFLSTIKAGKIVAPYYSPRGQEAIPSAVSALLNTDDTICTIYRGIHDMLAKGVPSKLIWAEIAGKITGTSKGKGGPMHITHPASGCMVTTGIVGSSMPIANGLALASQIRGEKKVSVAYFGDAASNIGAFHESLNMAAVWKLPVLFVCQNNGYGEHTRYELTTPVPIAARGAAYGIPGIRVDGNDPVAIYAVAQTAIERARAGEGPTLIEATCFRFNGHVFGDADGYMQPGEKAAAMEKDPVPRFRTKLIADGTATEAELAALEAEVDQEIDDAVAFALDSASPGLEEMTRDVYAQELAA